MRLAQGDLDTRAGFQEWTDALRRQADPVLAPPPGEVHATFLWIMSDLEFLGHIDVRHELNEFLADAGGHIGYSVRPSARGAGVATWALGKALTLASELDLLHVLLTCDPDNMASRRTIESNGGVYEDCRETSIGRKLRFWIDL
jgi:predicted acetyltransferase